MHERREETTSGLNTGTAAAAAMGEGKKNDGSPDSTRGTLNSGNGKFE
jgi:hypothetical protein